MPVLDNWEVEACESSDHTLHVDVATHSASRSAAAHRAYRRRNPAKGVSATAAVVVEVVLTFRGQSGDEELSTGGARHTSQHPEPDATRLAK